MAGIARTIRRGIMFRNMNKQQKEIWHSMHQGNKSRNAKMNTKQRQKSKEKE